MTSRRQFLGILGSLLPCIPLLALTSVRWANGLRPFDWMEACSKLFSTFDGASHIGQRYLASMQVERNAKVLASKISERIFGSVEERPFAAEHDWFRSEVTSAVRRDFERGDVIVMDGWVLSRTEVQICGLIALQRDGRATQI